MTLVKVLEKAVAAAETAEYTQAAVSSVYEAMGSLQIVIANAIAAAAKKGVALAAGIVGAADFSARKKHLPDGRVFIVGNDMLFTGSQRQVDGKSYQGCPIDFGALLDNLGAASGDSVIVYGRMYPNIAGAWVAQGATVHINDETQRNFMPACIRKFLMLDMEAMKNNLEARSYCFVGTVEDSVVELVLKWTKDGGQAEVYYWGIDMDRRVTKNVAELGPCAVNLETMRELFQKTHKHNAEAAVPAQ